MNHDIIVQGLSPVRRSHTMPQEIAAYFFNSLLAD
jgi:hypothetical protein